MNWFKAGDAHYVNLARICTVRRPQSPRYAQDGTELECIELTMAGMQHPVVLCGDEADVLLDALDRLSYGLEQSLPALENEIPEPR